MAYPRVSLVVPILNEADSLPALFASLEAQTVKPAEILFVDAGSTDSSPVQIEAWRASGKMPGTDIRVIARSGSLPGASRNAGVAAARHDWIAFLDGGLTADPDWLEALLNDVTANGADHAFGSCRFIGDAPLAKLLCFLSTGLGNTRPVLPSSLFAKSLFGEIGPLPEHLRAAEDTVWINAFVARKGARRLCPGATVTYRHFPATVSGALKKWHEYAKNVALAGVNKKQQAAYAVFFAGVAGAAAFSPAACGLGLAGYALLRGVALPLRRSAPGALKNLGLTGLCAAPFLALALDVMKMTGFTRGHIRKLFAHG